MSRIPQSFLNDLVARTDLVDLIGGRVTLKRAGSNHKGLCPFHDEKTASFTVSADKGFFKCFGCGAYGNAIDFLMRYENREFLEAVEILAEMHHLEIPVDRATAPTDATTELYDVLREADQFFRERLREHPEAILYLKNRGIEGTSAGRFALGFAPDSWNALLERLGSDEKSVDRLIRAGLVARNEQGRTYDRFRNRIMFPIRDGRGRVIGFGGRLIESGEPKYLNSPDTPLFDKGRTLYGLYEARQIRGRPERIVVVEGYIDVIALDQYGVGPAMATMGTAATGPVSATGSCSASTAIAPAATPLSGPSRQCFPSAAARWRSSSYCCPRARIRTPSCAVAAPSPSTPFSGKPSRYRRSSSPRRPAAWISAMPTGAHALPDVSCRCWKSCRMGSIGNSSSPNLPRKPAYLLRN
jgi:hypothetical protein